MIAILEGTDAVGKSTHAEWAAGRHDALLHHYGRPDGNHPIDEYVLRVAGNAARNIIMDRSFIGSWVWAKAGFHPPILKPDQWNMVCSWYAEQGAQVTIIVRPDDEIADTIRSRGETEREVVEAVLGQELFIELALSHEILYMPVHLVTSDGFHSKRRGTT